MTNWRIAVALGASMVLHVAALTWVGHKGLGTPGAMPSDSAMPGKLIMGRLVSPLQAPSLAGGQAANAPVDTVLPSPSIPAPQVSPVPAAPTLVPGVVAAATAVASASSPSLSGFVPATQLSSRPVAIFVGELEPEWLKDIPGAAVVQLSVYVAADGSVAHVEIRKSSDARIAEMARMAFAQARYKPGVMQGRNVASRVDVSLDYEAQRERVLDPNAPRPAENVLRKEDIRLAAPLAPEVPQSSPSLR